MSEILENALDSLRMGLSHYLDSQLPNRDKWAILELFHSIELLLKERLHQEHRMLIYRNVDKPVTDDAQTVGLEESLARFANIGVEIPHEYVAILRDLRRRRNRIEHHRFDPDSSHRHVLGEALKFIGYFLEEHLDEDLKDHLSPDVFHEAKELMIDYDALLQRAEADFEAAQQHLRPKERSLLDRGTCPECGNRTVLIGVDEGPKCYFCDEFVAVSQCQYCAEYLPESEMLGAGICHNCFSYRASKD